jgi:hypothetical protein
MQKIVVDYNKWRSGGFGQYKVGEGGISLLNDEGYMCCLGFACLQLEPSLWPEKIRGYVEPQELDVNIESLTLEDEDGDHLYYNTLLSDAAIEINDDESTSPEEKIESLTKLFKEHNLELEFINIP